MVRVMVRLVMVLLVLGVGMPLLRADSSAERLARYRHWHEVCLTGDTGTIDTQIARFEKRLHEDPGDALARAFLGSACALRAKAGFWGPTKLKYLRLGEKHMEAAVKSAPTDPRVRMVRAIAYYRIPKRFKKRPTALSDFKQLVPLARDAKSGLLRSERQAILYYASLTYAEEKVPGAAELRAQCHRVDPTSEFGKLTR